MNWFLNDAPSKVFPLYSRANVGEVFPDPITPLNATCGFLANLEPGWRDAFVACSVWDHDLYDQAVERNPLACFGGYLFINMSLMRLFGVRVPGFSPEAVDLQYFGDMPGIPSYESEARPFDESPEWAERAGAWLMTDVLGPDAPTARLDDERAEALALIAARPDLAAATGEALAERLTGMAPVFRRLFQTHIEVSLKAGIGLGALAQLCQAVGAPEAALTLAKGIGDVDSAGASLRIWELGRQAAGSPEVTAAFDAGLDGLAERLAVAAGAGPEGVAAAPGAARAAAGGAGAGATGLGAFAFAFRAFLADWGFRGSNEWELRCPTWGTDPRLALAIIDRVRLAPDSAAPVAAGERGKDEREATASGLRQALAGNDEVLAQFEAILAAATRWCRARERQRTTLAMLVHEQRLAALELGRRGVAAGALDSAEQVYMLTAAELPDYLEGPAAFTATVAEREQQYLGLFDFEPPFVINGTPPPLSEWKRRSAAAAADLLGAGGTLQAIPGCPGTVRGIARVITDPSDPSQLQPGDILVAPITDPSWTPLFLPAAGVVVAVGSPFSHAAIVSRELGIPCVVSAVGCTDRIPNGATIEVDGATGLVTVVAV